MKVTIDEHVHDSKTLPKLIEGITKSNRCKIIDNLCADGAYDGNDIFRCLSDNGILHRIKVRKNAKIKLKTNHLLFRNFSVLTQRIDLQRWNDNIVYGMRWIVETVFFSIKRMFGDNVYSAILRESCKKAVNINKFEELK